jgi:acyl-CoA reductase-like NAD-dependent aldehyde dehydrogenase
MVKKSVRAIVAAIAAAATRWSEAGFAPRARIRNAVSERTGYSPPAIDFAFDTLFGSLRRDAIEAVIADELGCLDVLDEFVARGERGRVRALPLGRVCVVASRTTIGVALLPAVFALCAKCPVLVKDREDRLIAAFFETLAGELDEADSVAIAQTWKGGDDDYDLTEFDAVVAFGSDATLGQIANALSFPTRFIPYGTKASAGYVAREALMDERVVERSAPAPSRDLVLYESEGCLSLHALFVERGGVISPERFAELLSGEIRAALVAFPPGPRGALSTVRRAQTRDLEIFRGAGAQIYADPRAEYLIVLDPSLDAPPAFQPLSVRLHVVDDASQAAQYFARHGIAVEALAVAHSRSDVRAMAAAIGVSRIASFGTLQTPPLGAFHGGRPRIAEFVRWVGDAT